MSRIIPLFLIYVLLQGCGGNAVTSMPQSSQEIAVPPYTSIKVRPMPFKVIHADFNRDGREDMAVVSKGYQLVIYMNRGDGSFTESLTFEAYVNNTSAVAADFNNDGHADIVMLTETLVGPVFTGDGRGGFARHDIRLPGPGRGLYMDSADLNNDGLPDLIAVGVGGAAIYINKGNLQFEAHSFRFSEKDQFLSRHVSAADINGDGYKDIIVPDYANGRLYVIWNNGGAFSEPQLVYEKQGDTISSALPLTIDGRQCIALSLEHSGQLVFLDAKFHEIRRFAVPAQPYSLSTADMNNDGFSDIIITHAPVYAGGKVAILYGPSFEKKKEIVAGGLLYSSTAFDWNSDGIPDLFVTDFTGSSIIYMPSPINY